MWTITLPLQVPLPRKKGARLWPLNLNVYRNSHPQILNQAKVSFDGIAGPLIRAASVPRLRRCTLEYVFYAGTARLCDTNNVCAVADKFFSDSLVNHGVIEDDNYNFIIDCRFRFGGIDRQNPRVDVVVRSPDHIPTVPSEPLQESPEPMKIITTRTIKLVEKDVENAITEFIEKYNPGVKLEADTVTFRPGLPTSLEITVEQEEGEDLKNKASKTSKKAAVHHQQQHPKPERLEPAAAMAALPGFSRVTPVQAAPETASEAPAPAQAPQTEAAAPSQGEQERKPEPPPPPKAPSLFASFTRPSNP